MQCLTGTNSLLSRTKSRQYHLLGSDCLGTRSQNGNQSGPVKRKVLPVGFVYVDDSVISGVSVGFVANVGAKTEMGVRLS